MFSMMKKAAIQSGNTHSEIVANSLTGITRYNRKLQYGKYSCTRELISKSIIDYLQQTITSNPPEAELSFNHGKIVIFIISAIYCIQND